MVRTDAAREKRAPVKRVARTDAAREQREPVNESVRAEPVAGRASV